MRRNLIDMTIISVLYLIIALIATPFDELSYRHFVGLLGVVGYYIVKMVVTKYKNRKREVDQQVNNAY
jgi:uncharacterized RDD family membrane protein YckC